MVRDANDTEPHDGNTVAVIKDLQVKNIRLVEGDHDIDRKIDAIGSMGLKSKFVKKA